MMQDNAVFSVIDAKKNKLKRNIINELYRSGPRTLSQLAAVLHTSIPSVTALVEELNIGQWAHGVGTGPAQFGRKPSLFALDPARHVTIVADINRHDVKLIIFNLANQVLYRLDADLHLNDSETFLSILREPLEQIVREADARNLHVIGVGVALPGLIDPVRGINYTYPHLNHPNHSLPDLLQELFNAPTYLLNDTKATILGEHRFGLAKGKNHVLSINIDWGIGLAAILNGELLQGASGFAGELGHIQIQESGQLCYCGKVGCLDTMASAYALIQRVKAGLLEGRISKLAEEDIDRIDVETVIDQANAGDAFAIDMLTEIGSELGRGLSIAVHLFNPERIIINGVLAKADKLIRRPIEQAIDKYCLADYRNNLSIEISQLGEMAKLAGAHAFVMQSLLDQEQIP